MRCRSYINEIIGEQMKQMADFLFRNIKIFLGLIVCFIHINLSAEEFRIIDNQLIVDQNGRQIQVIKPFNRIISLYGAHTENLFGLGLDEEIIGVSVNDSFPKQATSKNSFSYHDDPEKFLAARPDLVLIRPMIDRGYPQLIDRLEKSRITVVSIQPGTVDEMLTYWKILGILTGKLKEAEQQIDKFRRAVEQLKELTKEISPKKRVYFESIHSKMKTFSNESMAVFALETAGGIHIAKDAIQVRTTHIAEYGKERILARGHEIDVYLAQSGSMNQPSVELIVNEPGFRAIKAVRENQVYIVDETLVSRPTMRLLIGIYHIGQILYPEVFGEKAISILKQSGVTVP